MAAKMSRWARKITRLSAREWADIARAQVALVRAQYLVRTRPTGELVAREEDPATRAGRPAPVFPQPIRSTEDALAVRLANAVERAAMYGVFRPQCLVRAVALHEMLEEDGIRGSQIRIGVGRDNGVFVAHAWVEYGDLILGDNPWRVRKYAELTGVRPVAR